MLSSYVTFIFELFYYENSLWIVFQVDVKSLRRYFSRQ